MMIPRYVTAGGIVLDWVLNSNGEANPKGAGGNALYSAVGASIWSDRVAAVGRAAQDYPAGFLQDFAAGGVDVSGVRRVEEPTRRWSAFRYDRRGDRVEYNPEAVVSCWGNCDAAILNSNLRSEAAKRKAREETECDPVAAEVPAAFWQAKGFHLAPMTTRSQLDFAQALYDRSVPFTLDPSHTSLSPEYRSLLGMTSAFLPSEQDAVRLLGDMETEQALAHFASLGPQVVAIKLGRQGSVVRDSHCGQQWHVPAYPADTKDPTGAGDAYCGGFLVGWVETGDALEAALRGTVSASFVVEGFDARYALRFARRDAEQRVRTLRAML